MALPEIKDADFVRVALAQAQAHAEKMGKPVLLSRVALYLGVTSEDLSEMIRDYPNSKDEDKREVGEALKIAKQACRADLEDCMAEGGNRGGYIFLGKVNHNMVETTQQRVEFAPIVFEDEAEIPD